jgi:DNA polymerase-1
MGEITKKIHSLAGRMFNINSSAQLRDILFASLALPVKGIKKGKTGYSTSAPELEKLAGMHPIISLIQEHRELSKLLSTYVDVLPNLLGVDGRVHTTFHQTATATGRLSSSEPNLQNIPIRTEQGRMIRRAFVAERGHTLISADYSQIELRIVAVLSNDQPFIQAFRRGADIHTHTASEVFGVEEKDVTSEQRRAAKAVNFGILYGMGPRNLARSTGLSVEEARDFIDRYFDIHHAIRSYIDEVKRRAHADGYLETLFGRRRYFPELKSGVAMLVAQAERMAVNLPIQGTQADLVKMAMGKVDRWLRENEKLAAIVRLLLQVHDELVFEVEDDAVKEVIPNLKHLMESVASLSVPLVVDVKVGKNWGEMRPWAV